MTFSSAKPAHGSFAELIAAINRPRPTQCPGQKRKPKPTCRGGGRGSEGLTDHRPRTGGRGAALASV